MTTALAPLISATHAEEGCHAYTFAWDVSDPTLLRFYEEWENQEALEAHLKTEHVRVFNDAGEQAGGDGVRGRRRPPLHLGLMWTTG